MVVITVEKIPEGLGWLRLWRLSAGFVARSARYSRLPPAMNHFNVFTHNTHISIKKKSNRSRRPDVVYVCVSFYSVYVCRRRHMVRSSMTYQYSRILR